MLNQPECTEKQNPGEITRLLHSWSAGHPDAFPEVFQLVYVELKQLARQFFRRESPGHTLQTTALLHELYIRLAHREDVQFNDRTQFLLFAGHVMRFILAEHARKRCTLKRGGGQEPLPLNETIRLTEGRTMDLPTLLALDEALTRLEKMDPRQGRIIELRFFAGLRHREIAQLMDLSPTTVKREWHTARLWLHRELAKNPATRK